MNNILILEGFEISSKYFKRILCSSNKIKMLAIKKCRLILEQGLILSNSLEKSSILSLTICLSSTNYLANPQTIQANFDILMKSLSTQKTSGTP
ncbi:unnamed protein product [Moneuplotes crassus]|uniref:Uncharacterized protein n=1 Tax=Euplotes crassus TaxID=5936 RepID=A0AAD1XLS8_EUPCR|nr:unnamed protein product [Moneuplotes crassus]